MDILCPIPQVEFDRSLIERYDGKGPRYTSYPTADRFLPVLPDNGKALINKAQPGKMARPASLYFHIPFCDTICFYCGCNKIITKDSNKAARYVAYLQKEMGLQVSVLSYKPHVGQIHWGGGTPTFLSDAQISQLMLSVNENFILATDGEYSIELDPRKLDAGRVAHLAAVGLNRMSVGVQDFDPRVQAAVNRIQSEAQTRLVINAGRAAGFRSVSIDLIYGLPYQSVPSVMQTLDKVIDIYPDRIALYNYAHLPARFKPQRRIDTLVLPGAAEKLDILQASIDKLISAGYVYIGMDHFALPDDDLAIAQQQGTLQRNFQGYSTFAESDLLAFGVSAIGKMGAGYMQNVKDIDDYYALLDQDLLPLERGYLLSRDDLIRRAAIQSLMCQFNLFFKAFELSWLVDFADYFAPELAQLEVMVADGLLEIDHHGIKITPKGRMLVRSIAMVFDRYLQQGLAQGRYSRLV